MNWALFTNVATCFIVVDGHSCEIEVRFSEVDGDWHVGLIYPSGEGEELFVAPSFMESLEMAEGFRIVHCE